MLLELNTQTTYSQTVCKRWNVQAWRTPVGGAAHFRCFYTNYNALIFTRTFKISTKPPHRHQESYPQPSCWEVTLLSLTHYIFWTLGLYTHTNTCAHTHPHVRAWLHTCVCILQQPSFITHRIYSVSYQRDVTAYRVNKSLQCWNLRLRPPGCVPGDTSDHDLHFMSSSAHMTDL